MPADRTSSIKHISSSSSPPLYNNPLKLASNGNTPRGSVSHGSIMNTASYGQRQRSASGAGSISSQGSVSKMNNSNASSSNLAPFPTLLATSQSVLGQNLYDIMWKTFVAFEQDMRDCSQLAPLMPGIEATVNSAIDPIRLAGDCLSDTAHYIETEVREAIEETLANNGVIVTSSASSASTSSTAAANTASNTTASATSGNTGASGSITANASDETSASATAANTNTASKLLLACPVSYSKQFSLASTRISGSCSTFRATQASLRYYGGARKTAYQLDLFVHKFALPTSTALHKRGQEFSAANKWLKKLLNNSSNGGNEAGGGGRMLEHAELQALKRAGGQLRLWAEGLRIHADILKTAATQVATLMSERVSLQAYAFPPRPSPLLSHAGIMSGNAGQYGLHHATQQGHAHQQQYQQQQYGQQQQHQQQSHPMTITSPMSQWTTINGLPSATDTPSSSYASLPDYAGSNNGAYYPSSSPSTAPSSLATPENTYQQILPPSASSASQAYAAASAVKGGISQLYAHHASQQQHQQRHASFGSPPSMSNANSVSMPPPGLPQQSHTTHYSAVTHSLPPQQGSLPPLAMPTTAGGGGGGRRAFTFATPTFVHDQSIYQEQQQHQQHHHQHQQSQDYMHHHQAYNLISPAMSNPDLSFPTEIFFDNLCM